MVDRARYEGTMRIATGKVVSGKIVVDGDAFSEGATVTVLAPEDDEVFDLSADDEAALLAAIDEAERGATIDAEELFRHLDRK